MYIRPAAIGMAPVLGVHASEKVRTLQYSILFSAVLSHLISSHLFFIFFHLFIRFDYLLLCVLLGHTLKTALTPLNCTLTLTTYVLGREVRVTLR